MGLNQKKLKRLANQGFQFSQISTKRLGEIEAGRLQEKIYFN